MRIQFSLWILGVSLWNPVQAEDDEKIQHFESRIRPVLVEHCYECHSVEADKSKGGLLLDSREGIRTGGDTGPSIVPGNVEESLLIAAIAHSDPDFEMPPKKPKLSDAVIADFKKWVESGAADPRDGSNADSARSVDHWSYLPVLVPKIPAPSDTDWASGEIDRFVLAKLEGNDIEPSPDAEPHVLLRRLCFDLIGLPPTPEQMAAFSAADIESTVDELLASDGFGVRWGRHWLDVVRYAESNGRESNIVYPNAWRYRDYVIDAVNRDVPFDRFLTEQISGDLLPFESEEERTRLLIATGFLALGAKGLNEQNHEQFAADLVDEQLDALSRAFLASSIACARCHDHKSDPVSMEDYYSLIGIFKSTDTYFGTWIDSENNNGGELIQLPGIPGQLNPGKRLSKEKVDDLKKQLAELDEQESKGKELAEKAKADGIDMRENFNAMLRAAIGAYWKRGGLEGKLATVDDEGNPLPLCMGVLDAAKAVDSPVYVRGELKSPTDSVPRGVPALFNMEAVKPESSDRSGRLALAGWVTRSDHPLTARVMANRVWSHLFGAGLVETVDNFGPTGQAPSHPALLDYLAVQLRESGWSVKKLVREIVLSRAYRQSSTFNKATFDKDPDNRLLWRANKRRLDAEAIRDAMLAVSGEIDLSPRPGSLASDLRSHSVSLIGFDKSVPADLDGSLRRSVYLPVFRENLPDILDLFDFAEPSLVMGEREETNVPLQALYLMNSEFITDRSGALAGRLMREESSRGQRIDRAFQLCYNRPPDKEEIAMIEDYFTTTDSDEEETTVRFCQAILSSAEFRIAD